MEEHEFTEVHVDSKILVESFAENHTLEESKICNSVENLSLNNTSNSKGETELMLLDLETSQVLDAGNTSEIRDLPVSPAITCCGLQNNDQFFKGCKWSPDDVGNRILTCDGENKLQVQHCFLNKLDYNSSQISDDCVKLYNIGKIYDYDWYPVISPSNYYIMVASSLGPLHIYDLAIRKCISSYQMFNMQDEAVHAHCVTCFPDGSRILGATADYIFSFDVNLPGRTYQRIPTREYFKKGILSAIAASPIRYSMFAVGSYNNRIGIYDENKLLCLLYGHPKGITHLKFSPDGLLLYSGTRGSGEIICWDLRNPGTALYKLERIVKTQQRIYFDITSNSRYVFSGSTDGYVSIWDTNLPPCDNVLLPVYKFQAHQDCTNGISVHSRLPFIATVSGQYHGNNMNDLLHQYDSDDNIPYTVPCQEENTLKLWHVNF